MTPAQQMQLELEALRNEGAPAAALADKHRELAEHHRARAEQAAEDGSPAAMTHAITAIGHFGEAGDIAEARHVMRWALERCPDDARGELHERGAWLDARG